MGRLATILGFALHAAVLPVYLVSGLVVPWYVVPALVVVWGGLLVLAVQRRSQPGAVLAAPVAAIVVWVIVVSLGSWLFDWTA